MWECYKCKGLQTNPSAHHEHLKVCKGTGKREEILGWQGLEVDGVPRNKDGILLSDLYPEWQKP